MACSDTTSWRNGRATASHPQGYSCRSYNNWCRNGHVTSWWAAGRSHNYPEKHCCVCGGGTRAEPSPSAAGASSVPVALAAVSLPKLLPQASSVVPTQSAWRQRSASHDTCRQSRPRIDPSQNYVQIGVLGGSISWGAGLANHMSNWPSLLQRSLRVGKSAARVKVHNRAMPSTGVSLPSFCMESLLLPQARHMSFLLVEFNFNDYLGHTPIKLLGGQNLSPSNGLERLLRRVLAYPRPPVVGIVAICRYGLFKCERIFDSVFHHYQAAGVFKVSLWNESDRSQRYTFFNKSHHPTAAGHAEVARLVAKRIRWMTSEEQWPSCADMPLPRWLSSSWERPNVPWQCSACAYRGCPLLQPIPGTARGFWLHGSGQVHPADVPTASNVREGSGKAKVGWLAIQQNSTIGFPVSGGSSGARLILVMLCSYENMGTADVYRTSVDVNVTPSGVVDKPWHSLDMAWASKSSQQCLHELGHISPGQHRLWLRLTSDRRPIAGCRTKGGTASQSSTCPGGNQVKVYGIYTQSLA